MIKIVRVQKTKRGRLSLFGEDGFLFSVDEETYAKNRLCEDVVLTEVDLEDLKGQSDTRKAKDQALRYLSLRAYGEQELYQKLLLKYDEHTVAAAMQSMCELGLLDDETFAEEKAKGMAQRGKSPSEISRKLVSLGIDRDLARRVVDEQHIDGTQAALDLVRKKYMDKLLAGEKQKVMAALARRGFSHREIKGALEAAGEDLAE